MRAVVFAYYLNSERYYEALEEQGFYLIYSYKVRNGEEAV